MPLDLDTFSRSKLGLSLAFGMGRATPPAVGRRLAEAAADALAARRESAVVSALRANRWVVSGGDLTGEALDDAVRESLRHLARCIYDLYHLLEDADEVRARTSVTPAMRSWIERVRRAEPVVFAGPHLSNFDLVGRAIALQGLRAQVLSVPDPSDAYRAQNELRRKVGLDVTPISAASLKAAQKRLEGGGSVLTGLDRPVPGSGHRPRFFSRQAELPVVHVRLAARSGAPLVIFLIRTLDDGTYEVDAAGPVPLEPGRGEAVAIANAEAALAIAEEAIRARPEQWAMPHAVWPEAVVELDALEGDRRASA